MIYIFYEFNEDVVYIIAVELPSDHMTQNLGVTLQLK